VRVDRQQRIIQPLLKLGQFISAQRSSPSTTLNRNYSALRIMLLSSKLVIDGNS
jgi:hypothetical protein